MSGAKREWFDDDFVMVHLGMVDALSGSWDAAALLSRIKFRSRGSLGWEATKPEMQAEMRMTEWRLREAINTLRKAGCLTDERVSRLDNTRRWSVVYEDEESTLFDDEAASSTVREAASPTPLSKKDKNSPSNEFEEWWSLYPKKVGKQAARRAYAKANQSTDSATILAGLTRQVGFLLGEKRRGFCPDPATWLNAGRWDDEVITVNGRQESRSERLYREGYR